MVLGGHFLKCVQGLFTFLFSQVFCGQTVTIAPNARYMDKNTRQQKEEHAKLLFLRENLTQKEIAEKVGVSQVTITKWVKGGKWESLRTSLSITREEQLANLYRQIAEINNCIAIRAEGQRYPNSKEADTINKLAAAIDKMERETGLSDIISVSQKFLEWLRKSDVKKAQEFSGFLDAFIKTLL